MDTIEERCPMCGQAAIPMGHYFSHEVAVPVSIKLFFISISINVRVRISYCPSCGFLRINIIQA
jgi:predicted RNA-binding Zn-ribbon protein involved in translation (DUF1610 family)